MTDRTIGLNLEELKKINHKILISSGLEKIKAVLGALKGNLADVLIIDQDTAEGLLEE